MRCKLTNETGLWWSFRNFVIFQPSDHGPTNILGPEILYHILSPPISHTLHAACFWILSFTPQF